MTLLDPDPDKAALASQRVADLIGFAAEIGAPVVTIGSFRGRASVAGVGARDRLASILGRAGDLAAEKRTRLAIEPLNRYETDLIYNTNEGLAFLQEINHPALGLLIDTYHANIEEASRTEPYLRALEAHKLFHVHLADNNRLYPGGGMIDFSSILGALKAHGYSGYISAELLPRPDPDTAARLTIALLRSVLERL